MIDRFLKAKHWQLFLLAFGLPMFIQIVGMVSLMSGLNDGKGINGDSFASLFGVMIILTLLFSVVFFGWFWSIGVGLQEKIPEHLRINLRRFKLFLVIPFVYTFVLLCAIGMMTIMLSILWSGAMVIIMMLIHLFSMFCIFHSLYQVAKTIKLAELQREVSFSDFAGEFFLIWFYPIGIWFVQPKVNALVKGESDDENELV